MSRVTASISTSLDGFVCGPNDNRENPLGDGGERLHEWVYDLASWREMHGMEGGKTGRDDEVFAESVEHVGAVVMGRRMFDNGEGPWGDDPFEGHWGDDHPSVCRCSCSRTTTGSHLSWRAGRRSPSSPTGSSAPSSRRSGRG